MSPRHDTVLLDVDGTLVDTTYHHALAWARAFRSLDVDVALWEVHRAIGMGGDKLVAAVAGDEVEQRHGDELRQRWQGSTSRCAPRCARCPAAADLVRLLKDRGFRVALASSGKPEHTDAGRRAARHRRPARRRHHVRGDQRVQAGALDPRAGAWRRPAATSAVMVGDSTYRRRGRRAGWAPRASAVRTGGFGVDELRGRRRRPGGGRPARAAAAPTGTRLAAAEAPAGAVEPHARPALPANSQIREATTVVVTATAPEARLLVVEDEPNIRELLADVACASPASRSHAAGDGADRPEAGRRPPARPRRARRDAARHGRLRRHPPAARAAAAQLPDRLPHRPRRHSTTRSRA